MSWPNNLYSQKVCLEIRGFVKRLREAHSGASRRATSLSSHKGDLKMKFGSDIVSWVVVLMAACSLFSMIGTLEIDGIINHELYQYGLQFSYAWADPYWTLAGVVFAMGWLNIATATAFHLRALVLKRKASRQVVAQTEKETTQTKAVEKLKGERPKPAETQQQPISMQVPVIEANVQERKEETQTAAEDTTGLGQTQPGQSERVEEQVREPEPSEETVTEHEESRTETWEIEEEKTDEDEQTSEQEESVWERSEETAEQENEEPESSVESTAEQEETEQEQPVESGETPVFEGSSDP